MPDSSFVSADIPVSLRNRSWSEAPRPPALPHEMGEVLRRSGVPERHIGHVWSVVSARVDIPEIEAFLDPRLKTSLPDPRVLIDMEKAAIRLVDAISAGEKVGIWSDYDCDGATSAAILGRFLRMLDPTFPK